MSTGLEHYLAVLGQTDNPAVVLQQAAQRIDAIPDRRQQNNLTGAAYILAGLVLETSVIQQILRADIMQESVTYQAILREGREEGQRAGELTLVLRLLTKRVGALDEDLRDRISNLSSEHLEELGEALLEFTNLADLTDWLQAPPPQDGESAI